MKNINGVSVSNNAYQIFNKIIKTGSFDYDSILFNAFKKGLISRDDMGALIDALETEIDNFISGEKFPRYF